LHLEDLLYPTSRNAGMRFGVLGCLEVRRDGNPVPIGSTRERTLLAVLLLRHPHPATFDELVERLWGVRSPMHPKAAIHTIMTRLRQRLGDRSLFHTEPGGYLIRPQYLDLREFLERVAAADRAARQHDPIGEADELRAGLALWRGPVLANVASESLHREVVPMLTEQRLAVLQRRIAVDLLLGRSEGSSRSCAALPRNIRCGSGSGRSSWWPWTARVDRPTRSRLTRLYAGT
jgi:DNA-binding SARP family transcriptional activator